MRKAIAVFAALVLIFACSDATGPVGPVAFAIVGGDGQTVVAGRDSLIEPVYGQAYRDESGAVAFRFGPTPLHAQDTIGTGVANILTCAAPIGDAGLEPWLACRETDSQGFVVYWFDPPTVAGQACAEIRATVDGDRTVLATTCSTVTAGPMDDFWFQHNGSGVTTTPDAGDTLNIQPMVMDAWDEYGNTVPVDSVYALPDSVVSFEWVDRGVGGWPVMGAGNGWSAVVPGPAGFTQTADGSYAPGLLLYIHGKQSASGNVGMFTVQP